MDQHRVAWLTTEDGRGYATLSRVRFATDGRNPYVVAEGLGGVAADSGSAGGAEIFG
jgi:hypothetical protein